MDEKIIPGLKEQIKEIDKLMKIKNGSPEFKSWKTKTSRLLERTFGKNSSHLKDFKDIGYSLMSLSFDTTDDEYQQVYIEGLKNAKAVLGGIVEELEEYGLPPSKENIVKKSGDIIFNTNQNQNINNNINISINNVLENYLTVKQHNELNEILQVKDEKKKESMLSKFLLSLTSSLVTEILKTILLGN